jgi:hypothetical protein
VYLQERIFIDNKEEYACSSLSQDSLPFKFLLLHSAIEWVPPDESTLTVRLTVEYPLPQGQYALSRFASVLRVSLRLLFRKMYVTGAGDVLGKWVIPRPMERVLTSDLWLADITVPQRTTLTCDLFFSLIRAACAC